jgi:Rrf2 family protein
MFFAMLRLSSRGRYAVRALFDIAFHAPRTGERGAPDGLGARPTQLRDIAERQRIPVRFLEQILLELKRAGFVESKRGPNGGFRLARAPRDIALGDVLRAVEGPLGIAEVEGARKGAKGRRPEPPDATDEVLADVARSVERCFDAVTIADVCARGERLGLRRSTPSDSYVI